MDLTLREPRSTFPIRNDQSPSVTCRCESGALGGAVVSADGKDSGTELFRIRAEGEEAAITVLHDEFARVPGRVAKGSRELDAAARHTRRIARPRPQ